MCLYVHPQAIKTIYVKITNQTSPAAFSFFICMAFTIDIADGRGLSNKGCRYLLSNKAAFAIHFTVKAVKPSIHD